MIASFTISFREAFEALLIIFLVITYLKKMGSENLVNSVIIGGIIGVLASIATGAVAYTIYTMAFNKALVEAIAAFVAVPILTSIIYWMARKGPRIREEVEDKIREKIMSNGKAYIGLATLGFTIVFREGFETVLFTLPLLMQDIISAVFGIGMGILSISIISYIIFRYGARISLRRFFYITSILVILIASGILGYGVHELIEYLEENNIELGMWRQPIYVISIDENNLLHEENIVGSILAVLIGYTTKMELLRAIAQFTYLVISMTLVVKAYKGKNRSI